MNSVKIVLSVLLLILLLASCENDLAEINKVIAQDQLTTEVAKDVKIIYSDSALIRIQITGPTMIRHLDKEEPRQEFSEGVKVLFYTPSQKIQSTLTAKHAVRLDRKDQIVLRDSVVWQSKAGEKLETEELIWEERKDKVYSNKFVKITQPEDVIYGYGFEANQDFTHWKINAIKGNMGMEGLDTEEN